LDKVVLRARVDLLKESRFLAGENNMAIITMPDNNQTLWNSSEVAVYLATIGIDYERWEPARPVQSNATPEEILSVYTDDIEKLKRRGGYVTADVIDVNAETPNLESMLAKFNREHWHDEDEVRLTVCGSGVFHIRPQGGRVTAIEVHAGDLIRVPRDVWHWFDLCADRRIRAIRLFQNRVGWIPHYTDSGIDRNYQPICLGPAYLRSRNVAVQW
jgi:1,2-dihydroxy-3-keto-5-methylthiopentene dioxygenase